MAIWWCCTLPMVLIVSGLGGQQDLGSQLVHFIEKGAWNQYCNTSWYARLSGPKANITIKLISEGHTARLHGSCLLTFMHSNSQKPLHLTFLQYPAFHVCVSGRLVFYEMLDNIPSILWEGECGDAPYKWPPRITISHSSQVWVWYSKQGEWPEILPHRDMNFELLISTAKVPAYCDEYVCNNRGHCSHRLADPPNNMSAFDVERNLQECHCIRPFKGPTCAQEEFKETPCTPKPCLNDGLCVLDHRKSKGFFCECSQPYTGHHCELHQLVCLPSICGSNGVCKVLTDKIECQCKDNWVGKRCDRESACSSLPCFNGGDCRNEANNSFRCLCKPPWRGSQCEISTTMQPNSMTPKAHTTKVSTAYSKETTPKISSKKSTLAAVTTFAGRTTPSSTMSATFPANKFSSATRKSTNLTEKSMISTVLMDSSNTSAATISGEINSTIDSGFTKIVEQVELAPNGSHAKGTDTPQLQGVAVTLIVMLCAFIICLVILCLWSWLCKKSKEEDDLTIEDIEQVVDYEPSMHRNLRTNSKWKEVIALMPSTSTLYHEKKRLLLPSVQRLQKASRIANQFTMKTSVPSMLNTTNGLHEVAIPAIGEGSYQELKSLSVIVSEHSVMSSPNLTIKASSTASPYPRVKVAPVEEAVRDVPQVAPESESAAPQSSEEHSGNSPAAKSSDKEADMANGIGKTLEEVRTPNIPSLPKIDSENTKGSEVLLADDTKDAILPAKEKKYDNNYVGMRKGILKTSSKAGSRFHKSVQPAASVNSDSSSSSQRQLAEQKRKSTGSDLFATANNSITSKESITRPKSSDTYIRKVEKNFKLPQAGVKSGRESSQRSNSRQTADPLESWATLTSSKFENADSWHTVDSDIQHGGKKRTSDVLEPIPSVDINDIRLEGFPKNMDWKSQQISSNSSKSKKINKNGQIDADGSHFVSRQTSLATSSDGSSAYQPSLGEEEMDNSNTVKDTLPGSEMSSAAFSIAMDSLADLGAGVEGVSRERQELSLTSDTLPSKSSGKVQFAPKWLKADKKLTLPAAITNQQKEMEDFLRSTSRYLNKQRCRRLSGDLDTSEEESYLRRTAQH